MAISAAAAETERRRMTQAVAEQGSRGYTTQEQTVKPSADLAAAAKSAIAAAPVDMSTGQAAQLASGTDAVAAKANAYADAQRQIFKTGQESAAVSENTAYDQFQTIADASNFKLDKYKEQLAEQEAYRNSLGGGGSSWGDDWDSFDSGDPAAQDGIGDKYGVNMETLWPHASLLLDDLERENYEISVESYPGAAEQMNADVDNMFRGALRGGADFQDSIDQLKALMMDEYGPYNLPEEYAIALITPWIYRWESAFLNRRPDSISPELRYARKVGNPDGTPQSSDGRPSSFSPSAPSAPSYSSRRDDGTPSVIPDWDKWPTQDFFG